MQRLSGPPTTYDERMGRISGGRIMNLRFQIAILRHKVNGLTLTRSGKCSTMIADVKSGRAHVAAAQMHLGFASHTLTNGNEKEAMQRLIQAYASWVAALTMQIPSDHRARLDARPDAGGRPDKAWLAARLHLAACDEVGGIAARCRAAIAGDEVLQSAFGNLTDSALRKAYSRGESELKRE